jgi:hypothetical protein
MCSKSQYIDGRPTTMINDEYGHGGHDEFLKQTGEVVWYERGSHVDYGRKTAYT